MPSWRKESPTGINSPNCPDMPAARIWIKAFRLQTLPLSLSATILGSFLAYSENLFKWSVFVLGSLTTLFLQILSNLANDYGDALKGTDNSKRLGPRRVTQSGLVSVKQIRRMIVLFVLLSLASGCLLIWAGLRGEGLMGYAVFFVLGIAAIVAAIKYTVGKRPYGYVGLGDAMVFIFFGILGVAGTYFLHSGGFHWSILLPAASVGLLSMGVLNLNNLRDHENDAASGKHTLVVRMGVAWAKGYHIILLGGAFLLALTYTILHFDSWVQLLLLVPVPLLVSDIQAVVHNQVSVELNVELKKLAMATLLFSLAFGLGLVL